MSALALASMSFCEREVSTGPNAQRSRWLGHAAYALTVMNRRARPAAYQSRRDYVTASFAARTMRWSGVIVGLFVLFHLAD